MAMPLKTSLTLAIFSSFAGLTLPSVAEETNIEKIVVKGQKIDRTLQETPASVAVITADMVEQQNLNDFYDVLARTPNVTGVEGTGFNIRGIDAFNVTSGGGGGLASVYIDGAPLPYRLMQQGGFSTWDISQVEILRGPQSTLQGRNALAGAVVMKTRDAVQEYDLKARIGMGEYGSREAAIAFGGGLIEDELSFRFSGEKHNFDGYNINAATGRRSDFDDNEFYRTKLRYTPSALPEFEAQLNYTKSKTDTGIQWVATQSGLTDYPINDIYDDRYVYLDSPTFEWTDTDMYVLNMDYDLSEQWLFSSISTYSEAQYGYEWDGDASIAPVQSTLTDTRVDKTTSQELRFTYEGEKLSGLVGFYYSNVDVHDYSTGERGVTFAQLGVRTLLTAPPEMGGLGLPEPLAEQVLALYAPADPVYIDQSSTYIQEVTTAAIFADFTYQFNEDWDIFAGIRYDREKQENGTTADISISDRVILPNPNDFAANPMMAQLIGGINQQLYAMADGASGNEPLADADFTAWLPKLGATYRINPDIATSFTIQKGYRSGGVGTNTAKATTFTFDPEYTWNYEWSLRSTWLDEALVANANLFYLDWSDQQVSVYLSGNQFDRETKNVGKSHVQGFETEFNYSLSAQFSLYGGIGYAKTQFDEFDVVISDKTQNYSGREFAGAPQWTGLIGADYNHGNGLVANLSANYQGSSQRLSTPLDETTDPRNDAFWLVNLRAGYQWQNYGVFAAVENLLDNEYMVLANAGLGNQTLSNPRTLTVRFEAEF